MAAHRATRVARQFRPRLEGFASTSSARALSSAAPRPPLRASFPHYERMQTRWNDNDMFGHVNNALYYGFVDDAINRHLIANGVGIEHTRFVAASACTYSVPVSYPDDLDIGLRVTKIGASSATYEVGIFRAPIVDEPAAAADEAAAATVSWVHVYVDKTSGRPTPINAHVRAVLETLVAERAPTAAL